MRLLQERRAVRPPVDSTAGSGSTRSGRLLAVPLVAAVVVAADQFSKTWALHHTTGPNGVGRHVIWTLWFNLTFNSGAAFGLGEGITPVVEAAVVVVVVGFLVFGSRVARTASWPMTVALGLVVGGAAGNLADRAFRHIPGRPGSVIDFIAAVRVGQHDWWPVFNVADSCIVVGALLLALSVGVRTRRPPNPDGPAAAGPPVYADKDG